MRSLGKRADSRPGQQRAHDGRAQHDAGEHLAHHARLADPHGRHAEQPREQHHDGDRDEEGGEAAARLALLLGGQLLLADRERDRAVRRLALDRGAPGLGARRPRRSACRPRSCASRAPARRGAARPRSRSPRSPSLRAEAGRARLQTYSPAIESGARGRGPGGGGSRVSAACDPAAAERARRARGPPTCARSSARLAVHAAHVAGQAARRSIRRLPPSAAVGVLDVHELAGLPEVEARAEARIRLGEVVAAGDRGLRRSRS